MFRHCFLIALAAGALAACNGDQSPSGATGPHGGSPPPEPSVVEISGTIVTSGFDLASVAIRQYGKLIPLGGSEAHLMRGLIGAEARVRGTLDANRGLSVSSFRVTAVNGLLAIDGVFTSDDGPSYGIRLEDGTVSALEDPPDELKAHVGARVWVTGGTDGIPISFGIIEDRRARYSAR